MDSGWDVNLTTHVYRVPKLGTLPRAFAILLAGRVLEHVHDVDELQTVLIKEITLYKAVQI
jgi:hypothetical protein